VATEVAQAPRSQLCALKDSLGLPFCKKYAPGEEAPPWDGKGRAGDPVGRCRPKPELGDRYFIVVDAQDQPLANVDYVLTDASGAKHAGTSDNSGRTRLIERPLNEILSIEILHPCDKIFPEP